MSTAAAESWTQHVPFVDLVFVVEAVDRAVDRAEQRALVQSVDVLLNRPPHPDLVDDVRRLLRGKTGTQVSKHLKRRQLRLVMKQNEEKHLK